MMRDYWLSKLFFDLQAPAAAEEYRAHRDSVLDRYPLAPEVRLAVVEEDVTALARRVNPYLLRLYFFAIGERVSQRVGQPVPADPKPGANVHLGRCMT